MLSRGRQLGRNRSRIFHRLTALRYVEQLLHGCGGSSCREATCATGRRNTSRKPVRDYTPRSARAIALTLASARNPGLRLCREIRSKPTPDIKTVVDGARDPSAFIQQLSDTSSIQRVCHTNGGLSGHDHTVRPNGSTALDASFYDRIRHWHSVMDDYSHAFEDSASRLSWSSILDENVAVASKLCECLRWLASTLPDASTNEWALVNADVHRGLTYPDNFYKDDVFWKGRKINLLDSLDHGPSCRILCCLIEVIAERSVIEYQAAIECEDEDAPKRGVGGKLRVHHQALYVLVSRQIAGSDFQSAGAPILIWLKKLFLRHWDGKCILTRGSIATSALQILNSTAAQVCNDGRCDELWSYFPAIPGRLDAAEVARSYLEAEKDGKSGIHILHFISVFMPHQLAVYFRTINHLKMRKAHSATQIASSIRQRYEHVGMDDGPQGRLAWLEESYLLLNVSRQSVVQDAFNQLWQRRRSELLRPLRVRLGETDEFEIGHDLGGVQIEFFNLLWRELLKEETGLFSTEPSTALTYFRPGSLQPLYMFELCGLLFGLAIYNGITLPVNFPVALYANLIPKGRSWDFMIHDRWPEETRSLQSIVREDIPGVEAVVPLEANGLRLSIFANADTDKDDDGNVTTIAHVVEASRIVHHQSHEGNESETGHRESGSATKPLEVDIESIETAWPGWRLRKAEIPPAEVTPYNKEVYAQLYSTWLSWGSVAPQFSAFEKGFRTIIDEHSTDFLTLEALTDIVEGTKHLDINALMRATEYENYDSNSRYIRNFWRLATSWPEEKQRQLLKFVTAIERMPAGGAHNFTFKIERQRPDDPDKLPTSSTCFRTLYLPKYPSMEVLDRKLSLAFEYGLEGFGTG